MSILITKNYAHISLQYNQSSSMKLKCHQSRNLHEEKRKPLRLSGPKLHVRFPRGFPQRTLGKWVGRYFCARVGSLPEVS